MQSKKFLKRTVLYPVFNSVRSVFRELNYRITPVKRVIDKCFFKRFQRNIDWENPQDYNEKINWLKLYSDTSMWTKLADKYAVREYVKSKGLEQILVPLYGYWTRVDDIDFGSLPK